MRSLAPNSLILTGSNILNAVLGFSLSFIVGRRFGESGFGIWVYCLTWASILTMICEFGLNSYITREASRIPENANRLLVISLVTKLVLVSIFGGVVWFFAPALALNAESTTALRISMLIVIASVAFGSFTAIFRSARWMTPILWLNLLGGIIQIALSIWIIRSGGGILALIWVAFAIDFGQLGGAILLWRHELCAYGGGFGIALTDVAYMIRDTLPFAFSAFLGAIEARLTILLLGYFRDEIEVGRFGMASRFFEAARIIPNGIYDATFPALAAQPSVDPNRKVVFRWLLRVISVYTGIVTLVLALFARGIIQLTFGDFFLPAIPILSLLALALLPTLYNAVFEVYLFATGDENYATKLGLLGLIVQIISSVPLVFVYGAFGAAVGILVAELAIWLPLQWRVKKLLQ